jgi:hypothetical protein
MSRAAIKRAGNDECAAVSELLKPYDARTMRCNALAFLTLFLNKIRGDVRHAPVGSPQIGSPFGLPSLPEYSRSRTLARDGVDHGSGIIRRLCLS